MRKSLPKAPIPAADVLDSLRERKKEDVNWRGGRVFSLVYHAGEAHEALLREAHALYASANLLNPMAFRGLRQVESEVVQMACSLLNAPEEATGCMTSGGTESILVAVQSYRDRARKERPWIRKPELLVPTTIHPAFDKAAHYFGVHLRKVPVGADQRADVAAMARRVNRSTIGIVGSAPQYPHGVVDPIRELGDLAVAEGLPFHVDACVGGFVLPFVEKLGRFVPTWDFRIPGVTSISADLHKYAYAGKGASTLLWRSMEAMKYQFFVATEFPGGIYASPTLLGTRPGGPVAAAWASLVGLGEEGYLALCRASLETRDKLIDGVRKIPGLTIIGEPHASLVAWGKGESGPDVFTVADRLEARGWSVDRQHRPASVHLTCAAHHAPIIEEYVRDLAASVDDVRNNPSIVASGSAPMYGMMAKIPARGMVSASVKKVLEAMYAPGASVPDPAAATANDGLAGKVLDRFGGQIHRALDAWENSKTKLQKLFSKDR